ncbi:MAG: CARDB domain-containing protein, partial [Chloroflexota bacterium]
MAKPEAAGQSRLTVESIRVKGKDPDGQKDCDPVPNEVRVTVKNGGNAASPAFSVKLEVDDEDAAQKPLSALGPGASVESIFPGVQLKKGEHRITVSLDLPQQGNSDKDGEI